MKYSIKDEIDEGWSVQIYGRDRRLLCSLYPSHGWTFLAGFVVGLLLALIIAGYQSTQASSLTSPSSNPTSPNPHEPLLQVD
jgi:hypothetical protein